MKVLWFINTYSLYPTNQHHNYYGGGWIESLQELIAHKNEIELGVSFYHPTDNNHLIHKNVNYYPILNKKKNKINRLINNWNCKIENENNLPKFLKVVKEFQPNLIHVFGTENDFLYLQSAIKIPIVIHIQGLISPCYNAFYPIGINNFNILFYPGFILNHLLGNSILFNKKRFKTQAKREIYFLKNTKFLMGRSMWDRAITNLIAPKAKYFHVNEVLRPMFYNTNKWEYRSSEKLIIISTISKTIYKGLDLIHKTANVLKLHSNINFEWHVIGLDDKNTFVQFFESVFKKKFKALNVVFKGAQPPENLIKMLLHSHIYVHPSYIDNSPNSLCEAQILGIPVIACNVGGISSIIEHGNTGILIPSNSPFELAHYIGELNNNESLCKKLSDSGRMEALKRHNKAEILESLLSVYNILNEVNICKNF